MADKMTRYQRRQYLKEPSHCPYCDHKAIDVGNMSPGDSVYEIGIAMSCPACGRKWLDLYELKDVEEICT